MEALAHSGTISQDLFGSLKFLLAAATYIRLSTYLHHDSHDDRMALSQKLNAGIAKASELPKSSQRWFLPSELFTALCTNMMPLKQCIQEENFDCQHLSQFSVKSDSWWTHVETLYYSGNETQALTLLKQRCADLWINPVKSALQLHSSLPHSVYHTLFILSETLYWCRQYRAALQLYQYMTDHNISDKMWRIADCQSRLGDDNKAIEILNSITDASGKVYYSLGHAYKNTGQYDKAEQNFLQSLQIEYNNTSAEPLTDYNGYPLTTDCYVDLMSAASPEDRLTMITHITPNIITRLVSLGDVYSDQKKYSTAEAYYMKSLHFIYDLYGEEAAVPNATKALFNLAINYRHMKQYNKAEDYCLQALTIYRQISHGADSVDIARTLYDLGINYAAAGDNIKSREVWRQAVDIYMTLDPGSPRIKKLIRALHKSQDDDINNTKNDIAHELMSDQDIDQSAS